MQDLLMQQLCMNLMRCVSNLRTSFASDENIVENLQKAHQYSKSSVESDHKNFKEEHPNEKHIYQERKSPRPRGSGQSLKYLERLHPLN